MAMRQRHLDAVLDDGENKEVPAADRAISRDH